MAQLTLREIGKQHGVTLGFRAGISNENPLQFMGINRIINENSAGDSERDG